MTKMFAGKALTDTLEDASLNKALGLILDPDGINVIIEYTQYEDYKALHCFLKLEGKEVPQPGLLMMPDDVYEDIVHDIFIEEAERIH